MEHYSRVLVQQNKKLCPPSFQSRTWDNRQTLSLLLKGTSRNVFGKKLEHSGAWLLENFKGTLKSVIHIFNTYWTSICPQNCFNSFWHSWTRCWKYSSFCPSWHDSMNQLLQIFQLHIHDPNLLFQHISKVLFWTEIIVVLKKWVW